MIRRFLLPTVAMIGVVMAIFSVRASGKKTVATAPVAQPPTASFANYIAGAGLIEASTQNIAIGTITPGVIMRVDVVVGQQVKKGDPLFAIDDRELRAQLAVEDAAIASAKAEAANREREFARLQRAGEAASRDELDKSYWQTEIAKAQLAAAEARRQAVVIDLDRRVVKAPVDSTILRVETRVGEYASVGFLATPLMLLGDVSTLHVRVDVDENDAWRVRANAPAEAAVRGNGKLRTPLKFVRIEPYVLPKRSLTGDSSERVDTRVLQVIYAFDAEAFAHANGTRVYPGQQLDVFIEGPAATTN